MPTPRRRPKRSRAAGDRRETIAFLQYTSGSTSDPKGVVVTHGNLLENLEMIRLAIGATEQSNSVGWVPLYHDMGLIMSALESFYVGSCCALMAPAAFVQRPLVWLKAIQEYRGEIACVPNFAFDLCVSRHNAEAAAGSTCRAGRSPLTRRNRFTRTRSSDSTRRSRPMASRRARCIRYMEWRRRPS